MKWSTGNLIAWLIIGLMWGFVLQGSRNNDEALTALRKEQREINWRIEQMDRQLKMLWEMQHPHDDQPKVFK